MCSTKRVFPQPVGPFQHDREAARVTGFEHRDFVGDGQVVRGIAGRDIARPAC